MSLLKEFGEIEEVALKIEGWNGDDERALEVRFAHVSSRPSRASLSLVDGFRPTLSCLNIPEGRQYLGAERMSAERPLFPVDPC
jgi:hypothetical protein